MREANEYNATLIARIAFVDDIRDLFYVCWLYGVCVCSLSEITHYTFYVLISRLAKHLNKELAIHAHFTMVGSEKHALGLLHLYTLKTQNFCLADIECKPA